MAILLLVDSTYGTHPYWPASWGSLVFRVGRFNSDLIYSLVAFSFFKRPSLEAFFRQGHHEAFVPTLVSLCSFFSCHHEAYCLFPRPVCYVDAEYVVYYELFWVFSFEVRPHLAQTGLELAM